MNLLKKISQYIISFTESIFIGIQTTAWLDDGDKHLDIQVGVTVGWRGISIYAWGDRWVVRPTLGFEIPLRVWIGPHYWYPGIVEGEREDRCRGAECACRQDGMGE